MLLIVLLLCANANTVMPALTLPRATQEGIEHRPLIQASTQDVIAAKHLERKEWAGYLPTLNASLTSHFDRTLGTVTNTHYVQLSGSQLIYSPTGPQLSAHLAELTTQRSELIVQSTTHAVRRSITHTFLDAWLITQKASLIQAQQEAARLEQARADTQYKTKQITAAAYATICAQTAHTRALVAAYPHDALSARSALWAELGVEDAGNDSLLRYTPEPVYALAPCESYHTYALEHRPDLHEKKVARDYHTTSAHAQRMSYLPTLSAYADVQQTFEGTTALRGTTAYVGLALRWNFFDGLQAVHAARATDAHVIRTDFEYEELKRSVLRDITTTYHALESASFAIEAAEHLCTAQHALFEQATAAFEAGGTNDVVFYRARVDYEAARYSLLSAHVAYRKLWETLLYSCGYPSALTESKVLHE